MNAIRSLTRVVAAALPDWEVTWGGSEQGSFARPYCGIVAATPVASSPIGARFAEQRRTFSIACYPVAGLNAAASLMEGERVARVLWTALAAGIAPGATRATPHRVPLWSYEGVGLYEPGQPERIGYMKVLGEPSFHAFADGENPASYVVVGDVRLAWIEATTIPDTAPIVAAVTADREG